MLLVQDQAPKFASVKSLIKNKNEFQLDVPKIGTLIY